MKIRQNGKESVTTASESAGQAKLADSGASKSPFVDTRNESVLQSQLAQTAGGSPRVAAQLAAAKRISRGPHVVHQLAQIAGIGKAPIQLLTKDSGTQFPKGVMRVELTPTKSMQIGAVGDGVPSVNAVVSYKPKDDAPDADPIRLIQTVRASNSATKAVASWANRPEKRRDKTMTAAGDGANVQAGWFVDHTAAELRPRAEAGNGQVGDAYIDASYSTDDRAPVDAPKVPYRALGDGNEHGSKAGARITDASLKDHPASANPYKFEAEVVAKGKEGAGEQVYAVATWGFETAIGANDKLRLVTHDAGFRNVPSRNFNAASAKFNEVYRNADAVTSPENINRYRAVLRDAASSDAEKAAARATLAQIVQTMRDHAVDTDLLGIQVIELGIAADEPPAADAAPIAAPVNAQAPAHIAADAAAAAAPARVEPPVVGNAQADDDDWAHFPPVDAPR